jgi:hypothetical protein
MVLVTGDHFNTRARQTQGRGIHSSARLFERKKVSLMIYVKHSHQSCVSIPCPTCKRDADVDLPAFMEHINDEEFYLWCYDCQDFFYVKLTCLIRADELRNEAVDAGADESTKEVRTEE